MPDLYSGEEQGMDALVQVKFFTPDSSLTWYASEFNGDETFYGLVIRFESEICYFSPSELQEILGPWGLPIKQDQYLKPRTLRALKEMHERQR